MKTANQPERDAFLTSAKRAFRRVARQLRTENARLGLPLIVASAKRANDRTAQPAPTKAYNQGDATGFIRLNGLRLKVAAQVHVKK
jgi:hypothetical protein